MPEDRLTEILREAFEAGRLAAFFDRVPVQKSVPKPPSAKEETGATPRSEKRDEWHH